MKTTQMEHFLENLITEYKSETHNPKSTLFHKVAFYFLYNISEEMMLQQMLKCQELFWLKVKQTTTNQINVNKTIVPTGIQDIYNKCPFESSF